LGIFASQNNENCDNYNNVFETMFSKVLVAIKQSNQLCSVATDLKYLPLVIVTTNCKIKIY
jgi:hypothetical protein